MPDSADGAEGRYAGGGRLTRYLTMFYFLRDVPDGGELVFPLADSEVRRGVLRALCACPQYGPRLATPYPSVRAL